MVDQVRTGSAGAILFESEELPSRIRCTCISRSASFVALGTEDGTVQVFYLLGYHHLQLSHPYIILNLLGFWMSMQSTLGKNSLQDACGCFDSPPAMRFAMAVNCPLISRPSFRKPVPSLLSLLNVIVLEASVVLLCCTVCVL